ncbi:MAG: leucyl/phenylalanyl-tRNA--protein transferase, partial [Saprospiraceae bacterium]
TPRLILYPESIKVSKSMKRMLRETSINVSFDQHFLEVINKCSQIKRKSQFGTWIHENLKATFIKLHQLGIAHSVEVMKEGRLIGGLYGLAIGQMFCGESMFSEEPNMSKLALIKLCEKLVELDFKLIDCQQVTEHLLSMGGEIMEEDLFFEFLEKNKLKSLPINSWNK